MKTLDEVICNLENAPKRKGTRYVNQDDLAAAITILKACEDACDTLVRVADYMGILKEQTNESDCRNP